MIKSFFWVYWWIVGTYIISSATLYKKRMALFILHTNILQWSVSTIYDNLCNLKSSTYRCDVSWFSIVTALGKTSVTINNNWVFELRKSLWLIFFTFESVFKLLSWNWIYQIIIINFLLGNCSTTFFRFGLSLVITGYILT